MERWRSQTNLINVVFALLLFLSPWMLGFAGEIAAWNAWISGALLAAMSARAVVAFAEWEEWIELALGVWILASPWVLKFAAGSSASKVHVMTGAIVTLLAAIELWKEYSPQANA